MRSITPAILLCLFAASVHAQPHAPIKVGVMLCQTGACAETGVSALKGAELAASLLNATGGILGRKVTLEVQDTKEADSGAGSVTAFRALTADPDIHFIIGPTWDVGGMPLVPLMRARSDLLLVSPSVGVPEFSAGSDNIFNLWPLDELGVKDMVKLARAENWNRAAILSAQNNWAQTQAKIFEKELVSLGGEIVSVEAPLSTQTDIRAESLRIVSKKPDVVLFTMFAHLPIAAKQLRELGYQGQYLSVQLDQDRINASGKAIEGTIFPKYGAPKEEFVRSYRAKFSAPPQMAADTGYDALLLLSKAASSCPGLEPACLRTASANASFEGSSGIVRFSSQRTVIKDVELWAVTNAAMTKLPGR